MSIRSSWLRIKSSVFVQLINETSVDIFNYISRLIYLLFQWCSFLLHLFWSFVTRFKHFQDCCVFLINGLLYYCEPSPFVPGNNYYPQVHFADVYVATEEFCDECQRRDYASVGWGIEQYLFLPICFLPSFFITASTTLCFWAHSSVVLNTFIMCNYHHHPSPITSFIL